MYCAWSAPQAGRRGSNSWPRERRCPSFTATFVKRCWVRCPIRKPSMEQSVGLPSATGMQSWEFFRSEISILPAG
jgi:hypothetical protein